MENKRGQNKHTEPQNAKATSKARVALLNMNGMKNETIMKKLRKEMITHNIELLFVRETLGTKAREQEIRKVFKEYDVISRGRKKTKGKKYAERGGVMCIAKKGTVKTEQESEEDDVMYVTWNNIYTTCAFLVPPTFPFACKNEKKMEEMQERLFARGRAMLVVDANVWIGTLPSIVSGIEDSGEHNERVYERRSDRMETNKKGEEFVEHMNNVNMIILNGTKSEARYTYDRRT